MSRRLAIVQARMGSGRLPGKVLADLDGGTMLGRVLERLQRCRRLDAVIVATPVGSADDVLTAVAARHQVGVVRGPTDDVLTRYVEAGQVAGLGRRRRGDLRWTVDTPEDLAVVRRLYAELELGRVVRPYAEVVAHVRADPRLARGNAQIAQKHWSVADVA